MFTDDKRLMIKTMKKAEKELFIDTDLCSLYFTYITENENSMILKIYGAYEICISKGRSVPFLVCENMATTTLNG